ncbi:hypothetical protein V495_05724 [Pseudogymnoascus sp. VKM F-4514 (FW-929)]|nr:hypothetical protein V495_05724 [Pseudogymnoascus sp. VKM F-4514 (FW-929)]
MVNAISWLGKRAGDAIAVEIWQAQMGVGSAQTESQKLISSLVFENSKSIRTSTIILASFNGVAAFATAFSILYDCYCTSKRYGNSSNSKKLFLWAMHPAETFPLVLALGIVVQGLIFAIAQSFGLESLMIDGCSTIAQFVFPAIFLPSYIHIVFGVECAIRSLRKEPFRPRGKYDVTICLSVVVLMAIGSWIPTQISKQPNHCFASLMWFVTNFGIAGLGILSAIAFFAISSSVIIFYRLSTHKVIDQHQRIAASRVVYYLILKLVGLAFVTPWFVQMTIQEPTILTAMMATVVLNLVGLMTGALQLFLRANTATTSFRPKGTPGWSGKKHEIRMWGPNDLGFGGHILQPLSGPRSPASSSSEASFPREKYWPSTSESSQSPNRFDIKTKDAKLSFSNPSPVTPTGLPSRPNQNITTGSSPPRLQRHKQSQSYSLFPNEEVSISPSRSQEPSSIISTTKLPSTTFKLPPPQINLHPSAELQPPPSLFVSRSIHHFQVTTPSNKPSPFSRASAAPIVICVSRTPKRLVYGFLCDGTDWTSTDKAAHAQSANSNVQPKSKSPALQVQTQNLPSLQLQLGNERLSPQERAARMKTLPPVPRPTEARIAETVSSDSESNEPRLSPTVYMPPNRSNIGSTKKKPAAEQDEKPRASKVNWI